MTDDFSKLSEAEQEQIRDYLTDMVNGVCPKCKKEDAREQRGRCVYCRFCDHRIYQGQVPKSHGFRNYGNSV